MTTIDTGSRRLRLADGLEGDGIDASSSSNTDRRDPSGLAPIEAGTIAEFVDHVLGYFVEEPSASRVKLMKIGVPIFAVLAGAFATVVGPAIGAGFIGMLVLIGLTAYRPHYSGYIMIAVAPAIVGFNRGQIVPLLRPNEALLFLLWVVLGARWLLYSRKISVKLNRMDMVIVGLILTGLVIPLLVQFARLRPVSADDIFYGFVLVRLGLLYGIIRYTIRTPGEVRTAIGLSLTVASGLGLLGLMDSLNLLNTAERLNPYFPNAGPLPDDGRGAATIGNPIGFGVYCGMNACLAVAMLVGRERPRPVLAIAAVCCGIGVFGSGQIGPSLAFVIGLGVLALLTRSVKQLLSWSLPFILLGSIVIAPLAAERLAGFDGPGITGAQRQDIANIGGQEESRALYDANPGSSWSVRLYNLETYFLPEFDDDLNLWLGVSPQARVPSPNEGEDFIWIESGHLWLLWSGGVPLFVMFFVFVGVGMWTSRKVMRSTPGPVGICGAAAFASLVILSVATTFDPHLTLRGTSDILFPLLGLVMVGFVPDQIRDAKHRRPVPSLVYGATKSLVPTEAEKVSSKVELGLGAGSESTGQQTEEQQPAGPGGQKTRIETVSDLYLATGTTGLQRFVAADSPILVGRGKDCQVRIPDDFVSRVHLVLAWDGRAWSVSDHSKHGTFNPAGDRLDGSVTLVDYLDLVVGGKKGRQIEVGLVYGPNAEEEVER